ncbi:beta-1,4-N-acetylgalactosaminyltransferase 3 [Trichomycterus rosablanca]|uniref:beta-1,4-N-acetylgalactosaminyltransferase 3 n=1 Tax=Trichomycterus rosablanca TaxID=2290929 RepID=UPI002F3582C6
MVPFFPLRKIKRNGKYLLLGAVFIIAAIAAYLEFVATSKFSHSQQKDQIICKTVLRESGEHSSDLTWVSKYNPQPWKSEYKGQANFHVFEDWCGSSVASLRKYLHYPLYPHSRLTVKKLAVSPQWTEYGLRIFGYIHPYTDGEFIFAVASNNNCEFWFSLDENPENVQLLVYVGKTGKEWTAPGEYEKYSSQISKPNKLQQQRRYYFELIYKHDDHGTDHVEVAWRLKQAGTTFTLIDSNALSLYTNESSLKLSDVSHTPQTAASHAALPQEKSRSPHHEAEILREDPRDTFFQVPLLDRSYLQSVLPECDYKPSYVMKGFLLNRYQGLHFVHLSYVYPNDYTRLTHMESDNQCFYQANQYYLKKYSFSRYIRLDQSENGDIPVSYTDDDKTEWEDYEGMENEVMKMNEKRMKAEGLPDYENNYDDYKPNRLRKLLFTMDTEKSRTKKKKLIYLNAAGMPGQENPAISSKPPSQNRALNHKNDNVAENQQVQKQLINEDKKLNPPAARRKRKKDTVIEQQIVEHVILKSNPDQHSPVTASKKSSVKQMAEQLNAPGDKNNDTLWNDPSHENGGEKENNKKPDKYSKMPPDDWDLNDWDLENEIVPKIVYDTEVNWAQTLQVSHLDFQMLRNDEIDLRCNVSGNLLISESEAVAVVQSFMEQLNKKNSRQFTLQHIVNVVKRVDKFQGSRYLLELDLLDASGHRVRLVQYVYLLKSQKFEAPSLNTQMLLCSSKNFQWNPDTTVHFIVPVKNQARWVQKFIVDMEELYKASGDENFNVIIIDYASTDMDIEGALRNSHLPKSQYVRLTGNFERSAGLQAGVDLILDKHSIVFLCDLHIHFPLGFIDSVRKHCVEGRMVFAPIVMRLNCGATPQEPNGYWEVNGFGLLGIYKSDLEVVGGMNTKEFTDSWGGEDWELLDRIIEAGLEVERLHLRNFFHHYHSRRGMWNRKVERKT